jgi:integrase/recombinase XerD
MKNDQLPEPKLILIPKLEIANSGNVANVTNPTNPTRSTLIPSSTTTEPPELRSLRIEEFLNARSLAENSKKAYRADLARFTTWSNQSWQAVTPRLMTQFKTELMRVDPNTGNRVLADSSVQRILHSLKSFYSWMQDTGYISQNPMKAIVSPKLKQPQADNLNEDQINAIFAAAMEIDPAERNLALLSVLRHGLRASEVSGLNLGDYDGERVYIREAKADSTGVVPIDGDGQGWIDQYLRIRADSGEDLSDKTLPLFVSHSRQNYGKRLGYHGIQKLMGAIGKQVGFKFHAHQFRHTYATNLVLQGMNPYHVMTLTRHRSTQTFRRYTQAADQLAAEQAFRSLSTVKLDGEIRDQT